MEVARKEERRRLDLTSRIVIPVIDILYDSMLWLFMRVPALHLKHPGGISMHR